MKSVLLALVVLGSALSLHAQQGLPSLPTASQIFSVEDIKQYWLHKLSQKPLPPRPNSENSVILRSWQESIQAHNSMLDSIRQGELSSSHHLSRNQTPSRRLRNPSSRTRSPYHRTIYRQQCPFTGKQQNLQSRKRSIQSSQPHRHSSKDPRKKKYSLPF